MSSMTAKAICETTSALRRRGFFVPACDFCPLSLSDSARFVRPVPSEGASPKRKPVATVIARAKPKTWKLTPASCSRGSLGTYDLHELDSGCGHTHSHRAAVKCHEQTLGK